jgi:hypothetical protein
MGTRTVILIGLIVIAAPAAAPRAGGEIHGTITTTDGGALTGPIRWDRNENFWDDVLHARKGDAVYVEEAEGGTFRFLGLRLPRWGERGSWTYSQFSIPFGHLRALEPVEGDRVRLELKNGETLEIRTAGSDLGPGMRDLVIDDANRGEVVLAWSSVRRVGFSSRPGPGRDSFRLHGTVTTRSGELTGYVVWDRDESLLDDVIDGEEDGHEHKIRFSEIRAVERVGDWGSRVTLADGRTVTLEGTNDVDEDNRGISVLIPGVATVEASWDEFVGFHLSPAPPSRGYDDFDGGARLAGRVLTSDGRTIAGEIVWDRDEMYSWETLDGRLDGLDYAVPFANIRRIRRLGSDGAAVELTSGRVLELTASNDISDENKGIVVTDAAGTGVELSWSDVETVEFTPR